ncbi:MAG: phosphate/phosphite/phosphonate ABC transporter substrate-binding protein [Deltaproteobacteria bacterium]|nr:phosphate/phosphite/phosphonate ABC transporter substrate-binding protein [Deltaproteobacteria bacterium]
MRKLAINWIVFAVMILTLGAGRVAAQETPFLLGVLPNVSARVILANYQPVRSYFERELKRSVEIVTAADLRAFGEATLRGDYHMIVTAANLGRVAQLDGKWEPIAIYEPAIPALLIAGSDNSNSSVEQLRGKTLAVANPQSLVVLRGLQWLREQGLQDGRDFKMLRANNDDSLGSMIRSGEAPMAMMSLGEFRQIGEDIRKSLKVVTEIAKVPGFLVMLNPKLDSAEKRRIQTLVLKLPQDSEGKKFFALSGFANIREVTRAELESLDPFVAATRAGLAPAPK